MNALRAMQIVWPSAARALDLFRGAKPATGENVGELLVTPHHPERNKRAAEGDLDDSFNHTHSGTLGSSYNASYMPTQRHNLPPTLHGDFSSHTHGTGPTVYSNTGGFIDPQPAPVATASSMSSANMINSSYWHGAELPSSDLNAPISTAVIPQLYSTGLDTSIQPSHSRMHSHTNQESQTNAHPRRYQQQFWNEYQSYPQFGSQAYDIQQSVQMGHATQPAHPQSHHQQHQHQQQQQQSSPTQQMYLPAEHYSLYSMSILLLSIELVVLTLAFR